MSDQTFTWLHLSDFHLEAETDWQRDVVLDSLLSDVVDMLPERGLKPDAVFITGDIAHSGKDAEYQRAREFFEKLAERLEHDPSLCWFLVPGNHDVDRNRVKGLEEGLRDQLT